MRHKWGSVEVKRPWMNVYVSFNRGDEVAMKMIAQWFGMSYEEFLKIVPPMGVTYTESTHPYTCRIDPTCVNLEWDTPQDYQYHKMWVHGNA